MPLALGIYIGTTSVEVVIVEQETRQILANQSKNTQADVPSTLGVEGSKQDVPKMLSTIHHCVSRLPRDLMKQIAKIGICGQMHGVALWEWPQDCSCKETGELKLEIDKDKVSQLYTWQDRRCDVAFLNSLPKTRSHLPVHAGYGCATLFWFARNKPDKLKKYNRCGTVQDLVVSILCASEEVKMSTQIAASWGYFLTEQHTWDTEALLAGDFPVEMLPKQVLRPTESAGKLGHNWFGIPAGVTIGVALGDLQCSAYALLKEPTDAVLNISTSAQLAYLHPTFKPDAIRKDEKVEYFPYFDNKYLAVASSMNGGNTLATFVKSLQQWTLEFGFSVPQSKIWDRLIDLGNQDDSVSDMTVTPTLLSEHHSPDKKASITGITLDSMHLGKVFRALCSGIIKNMHDMMSREELESTGINRMVGNGSALTRNPVLRKEVEHWYRMTLEIGNSGDAALGAALVDTCT